MHVIQNFWGPNYFFWSALKVPPSYFNQKMSQAPSKCLKQWINWIISISAHRKWPEMAVSASANHVWTKIIIRSYAWSFGHSDPDPSNVGCLNIFFPCSALPLIINLTKKWILYLPKFIIWYVQYFREQVTFSTFKNCLLKHYSQKYGIYEKSKI